MLHYLALTQARAEAACRCPHAFALVVQRGKELKSDAVVQTRPDIRGMQQEEHLDVARATNSIGCVLQVARCVECESDFQLSVTTCFLRSNTRPEADDNLRIGGNTAEARAGDRGNGALPARVASAPQAPGASAQGRG